MIFGGSPRGIKETELERRNVLSYITFTIGIIAGEVLWSIVSTAVRSMRRRQN